MTSYTTVPTTSIDQDSPVTQPLMTALRDNPLAIQEGDSSAPRVAGAYYVLERQEPTTDVSAIEFSFNISGEREIIVEFTGQLASPAGIAVEIRASGGTWRRVFESAATAGSADMIACRVVVANISNADGTGVRTAWGVAFTDTLSFDRSAFTAQLAGSGRGGYDSNAETIVQARVAATTGNIEGSNADARSFATLYGTTSATRDA